MKVLQHPYTSVSFINELGKTIITRLLDWCKIQEKDRLLWAALIIISHGCIITPITILSIILAGNSMLMWAFAIGAMAIPLVSNLAAMPTKITIPVFFLSIAIDIILLINSIIAVVVI